MGTIFMSVTTTLHTQIAQGKLRIDDAQMQAARHLDRLLLELGAYSPERKLFIKPQTPPQGLYLWGGVGRGKSMLMDMFYDMAPLRKKNRVHFHAFMQSVHREIGIWRGLSKKERRAQPHFVKGAGDDPIAPVAKAIALNATLLCFDEFHVTDITDAMILSRLFTALFANGVVVITTSNRAPDDLYKDGLNRQLFLPFIELLKQKLDVFAFDGDTDHRLRKLKSAPIYYAPLGEAAKTGIETAWDSLTGSGTPHEEVLYIQGRKLCLQAVSTTARAHFDDLCGKPLGAADYLEIANNFTALVLESVPKMGPHNRDVAKRFVILIDALYEAKTKLILSADALPDKLYTQGDGVFEFARTASRLIEMQSEDYLGAGHELGEL